MDGSYSNQDSFPLANGVYFMVSIKKTPLHIRNNSITDPITKMEVTNAFEQWGTKDMSYWPLSAILSDWL